MKAYLKDSSRIYILLICSILLESCFSENDRSEFEVYLWDYRECSTCSPKEFFVEGNQIYYLNKGSLFSRILEKKEIDYLKKVSSKISSNSLDSTYYKHLVRYDFMVDLSVTQGNERFSVSVYDNVIPKEIEILRESMIKISKKNGLRDLAYLTPNELEDVWPYRIVNEKNDTILPSRETLFKIRKTLISTNSKDWHASKTLPDVEYEVLYENYDEVKKIPERIGITKDGMIYYKLPTDDVYYYTDFGYEVRVFPLFAPLL